MGQQRAAELLLLGKPFDAATAHSMGLVNRVVEEADLLREARALAQRDRRRSRPQRCSLPAACCAATPQQVLARIDEEAKIFGERLQSEEFRAAVRAFQARRRPG